MNIYIRNVIKDDNRDLKIPGRELTVSLFACSQKVYTQVLRVGSELLLKLGLAVILSVNSSSASFTDIVQLALTPVCTMKLRCVLNTVTCP